MYYNYLKKKSIYSLLQLSCNSLCVTFIAERDDFVQVLQLFNSGTRVRKKRAVLR